MIEKDITGYANLNWFSFRDTAKNLSRSKDEKRRPLVNDIFFMYDFDKISEKLSKKGRQPKSADALYIRKDGELFLIEFKQGFKWVLSRLNTLTDETEKKLRKKENIEFKKSIQLKAVESYILIEKKVLQSEAIVGDNRKREFHYLVVVDFDAESIKEDILSDLAKKPQNSNPIQDLRKALKRFLCTQDANGNDYFYDHIDVISYQQFPPSYLHR